MAKATKRRLWQVQGTVASYAVYFYSLMAETEWNKVMQMYQFCWSLQKEIKDELTYVEMSKA